MIRLQLALILAVATGYVSLSQEILWIRLLSFATGGSPDVFGHVLGFFLIGIALGALISKWVSTHDRIQLVPFVGVMLTVSAAFYFLVVPLNATAMVFNESIGFLMFYLSIAVVSVLIGGIFPLLCHLGISGQQEVGQTLSWMYLANIVGSVAGPILTGFYLLDVFSLEKNLLFLSIATVALAAGIFLASRLAHSS